MIEYTIEQKRALLVAYRKLCEKIEAHLAGDCKAEWCAVDSDCPLCQFAGSVCWSTPIADGNDDATVCDFCPVNFCSDYSPGGKTTFGMIDPPEDGEEPPAGEEIFSFWQRTLADFTKRADDLKKELGGI